MKKLIETGYYNNRRCIILSRNENGFMEDVFFIDTWWWYPTIFSLMFVIAVTSFIFFVLINPFLLVLWIIFVLFEVAFLDELL